MNIPAAIQSALRNPLVKKAWISEPAMTSSVCCQNCGGANVIAAFVATEGPYDTPANAYLTKEGLRLTSKSDHINGKLKWWLGYTISVPCPDCQDRIPTAGTPPQRERRQYPANE